MCTLNFLFFCCNDDRFTGIISGRTNRVIAHLFFSREYVMASSTLCVYCAQLPTKDRSIAAKKQRCPDCNTPIGVTVYGTPFRMAPIKRMQFVSCSRSRARCSEPDCLRSSC